MIKKICISASLSVFILVAFLMQTMCTSSPKETQDIIAINLHSLSVQDTERLTFFFKHLFFVAGFGYTIFGDKPMSFDVVDMARESESTDNLNYMNIEHLLNYSRKKEGWEVWRKYAHLFPLKGYSIISYSLPEYPNCFEIAIINHKEFIDTVDNHLADFQKLLECEMSSEQIFENYLLNDNNDVFSRIRNHDGLFGTLLGYGRENAWEFMKRSGGKTMESFKVEDPVDAKSILSPRFKVLPSTKETLSLRKKYNFQQQEINSIYGRSNFLEVVLRKLTGQPIECR